MIMNNTPLTLFRMLGAICLALSFSHAQEKSDPAPPAKAPKAEPSKAEPSKPAKAPDTAKAPDRVKESAPAPAKKSASGPAVEAKKSPAVIEVEKLIEGLKDKLTNPAPTDPEAHVIEKEIARAYLKRNDFEQAIEHMRNSVGIQAKPPAREFQALARLLAQTEKIAEAEALLKKGCDTHPDSPELLSMYAAVLSDNKKSEQAEKVLSEGLKSNAENKNLAYFRLQQQYAITLGRNKKWKEARAEYESIVKEAGDDSELVNDSEFYFGFGTAVARSGDLEAAAQHLQKSLELVPKPDRNFEPIRELMTQKIIIQSRIMSTTDPLDAETRELAEDQLRQIDMQISEVAQRLDKFRATVLNYLGYMWVDAGKNLDVAGELIKKAIDLDPDSEHIVDSLGWYYFKKGEYVEAMNELSRAEAMMEEENAEVFDHLAQTYFKIGNTKDAVAYLERAIKLNPDNQAELEARLKQYQGAKP